MRHDVLRAFDRVHTPRQALARWDALPDSLAAADESQNFVYRFRDSAGAEMYLRLTHDSHRSAQLVGAELDFVNYLGENGADVAAPVRSRAGNLVETLSTPIGDFHAAVFRAVDGQPVKWGPDVENRKILFERGKTLGQIHRLSQSFRPAAGRQRFHWYHDDLFLNPWNHFPESEPAARREYQQLLLFLLARPRTPENYGMIHGDFGSNNTLRQGGKAFAFDFDECCFHWFLFDVAVAILPARELPDKYRIPYLQVMLKGYASENTLSGDGPAEISMFCRLSALCRFLGLVRQLDPQNLSEAQRKELDERRRELSTPVAWE
jgi:Ser/Thr protein kinase RdoA (MazF antagonist)